MLHYVTDESSNHLIFLHSFPSLQDRERGSEYASNSNRSLSTHEILRSKKSHLDYQDMQYSRESREREKFLRGRATYQPQSVRVEFFAYSTVITALTTIMGTI